MSHVTGTLHTFANPIPIGPITGDPPNPGLWTLDFDPADAPTGTKLLMLHFKNASIPDGDKLEVDLGYGKDVFTAADGPEFWTRPINVYAVGAVVSIRYIGAKVPGAGAKLVEYARGERHPGDQDPTALSNSDPFFGEATYTEPDYDPFWYCTDPPQWENVAKVSPETDIRRQVAPSVGMMVSVHGGHVSTCTVTLVDADKVITAGHCMADVGEDPTPTALSASVTFDYQTDANGNRPAGYEARFHKVVEVLEHTWNGGQDYALLRLAGPAAGVPPVQLRHDIPAVGEPVFGIHHPNGAVKKLSVKHPAFTTVAASSANSVQVPSGFHITGGSSGSGLFDTAGRIIGVLSVGNPCGNAGPAYNLSYFPVAAFLQLTLPAPPPPVTRDVMVVFDRSGSMVQDDGTGRQKIEVARDAVSLFVQLVAAGTGNRVGLVSFSTTASAPVDQALTDVTGASKLALIGGAPYSGGIVGGLQADGVTSIGDGIEAARLQLPVAVPGANPRAILLMTDGVQNQPPMIEEVEGALGDIDLHVVGLGTEANLNGPLLSALAAAHNGQYVRAGNGLALEKFFSQAFGNIFAAGILMDPEHGLAAGDLTGERLRFQVCGEESITVVAGWDRTDAALFLEVRTPAGAVLGAATPGVEDASGRSWTFLRIPLPHGGARDGEWTVNVARPAGGGEFTPPPPALRYFVNVVPQGGPRLLRLPDRRRYYTGDRINPLAMLRYAGGGWPHGGEVTVTVSRPDAGVGNLLANAKPLPPATVDGDTIPAHQTTLAALEAQAGAPLIGYTEEEIRLFDDPANTEGRFEPTGIFGRPLTELLTMEGSYTFHFHARYGHDCRGTRELVWSAHVDVGVDPGRTEVTTTQGPERPDGTRDVTFVLVPRDRYGNLLGPGRGDAVSVTGAAGTTLRGGMTDSGGGSYTVTGSWDPRGGSQPGVVLQQPGRPCVVLQSPPSTPGERGVPAGTDDRRWKLLSGLLLLIVLVLLLVLLLS